MEVTAGCRPTIYVSHLEFVRCVSYRRSHLAYEQPPKRPKPKPNGRGIPVSSYLDEELYDALVALAAGKEHGVAAEIRIAVRKHVKAEAA